MMNKIVNLHSHKISDIGVVQYRFEHSEKRMHAVWYYPSLEEKMLGTGFTDICDTEHGYSGDYHIHYFDQTGKDLGSFDLRIEEHNQIYELYWSRNSQIVFVGVGMETTEGLSAGWRKVCIPSGM